MKRLLIITLILSAVLSYGQNDSIPPATAPVPDQGTVIAVGTVSATNAPPTSADITAEMNTNTNVFVNSTIDQKQEKDNNIQEAQAEDKKSIEGATPEFVEETKVTARSAIDAAVTVLRSDVPQEEKDNFRLYVSKVQLLSLGVSAQQLEGAGLTDDVLTNQGLSFRQVEELGIPLTVPDAAIRPIAEEKIPEHKKSDCDKGFRGPNQDDSRIEIAQLNPAMPCHVSIYNNTRSVAMIVEKENITRLSEEFFQLNTVATLGNRYNLCDEEPFVKQIVVGVGTGFIIGEDLMMTAAHVFERPLSDYVVVFGYKVINQLGTAETSITVKDIYYPVEVTESFRDYDLVKFRVDRKFEYAPLQWENSSAMEKGTEVYMIGYPCGLPQKLAMNSSICESSNREFFYTFIDSYRGNSGSPIFSYRSHRIIGVLVAGQSDYEYVGNCYRSLTFSSPYYPGEKAMRIELAFRE